MFRREIHDGEDFETDFIGASVEDCQSWEQQRNWDRSLYTGNIAILDDQSAVDKTVLLRHFARDEQYNFGSLGYLPPHKNTWYSFRLDPQGIDNIIADLEFPDPDITFPVLFGITERLTRNGVFDYEEARRLMIEDDAEPELFEHMVATDEEEESSDEEDVEQETETTNRL